MSLWLLAASCALALSACNTDGQPTAMNPQPRGASVAFESIDGPPQTQFFELVQDLNNEAHARQLDVISRERPAAYRVRGYLAAEVAKGRTTVSWVWEVFDADGRRALRIAGADTAKGRHHAGWSAADEPMLHKIASNSMDQLAAFLTSPAAAEASPPAADTVAAIDRPYSPEAADIFRIFRAEVDPVSGEAVAIPAEPAAIDPVPLPRRVPAATAAHSARVTVAATAAY